MCQLMEGGMVESDLGRQVYETIRYANRDPALLEWLDGSTFPGEFHTFDLTVGLTDTAPLWGGGARRPYFRFIPFEQGTLFLAFLLGRLFGPFSSPSRSGFVPAPGPRYTDLGRTTPMAAQPEDLSDLTNDPVARLLLSGRAGTLREAEELYLDSCLPEVVGLLAGSLSDEELGRHPLMQMLRSHGSRAWEEALE